MYEKHNSFFALKHKKNHKIKNNIKFSNGIKSLINSIQKSKY